MKPVDSPAQFISCSTPPELSNLTPFPPSALRFNPSRPCSLAASWQRNHHSASIFKWLFCSAAYLSSVLGSFFPRPSLAVVTPGCVGCRVQLHSQGIARISPSSFIKSVPSSSPLCRVWSNQSCQPSPAFFCCFNIALLR